MKVRVALIVKNKYYRKIRLEVILSTGHFADDRELLEGNETVSFVHTWNLTYDMIEKQGNP